MEVEVRLGPLSSKSIVNFLLFDVQCIGLGLSAVLTLGLDSLAGPAPDPRRGSNQQLVESVKKVIHVKD